MTSRFRAFARSFLITVNILLAVFYLLACLAPYLNPYHWWFISLLGLFFSFMFFLLLFSILFWLVIRIKYALLFFIVLLFGWKSIRVSFAFNFFFSSRRRHTRWIWKMLAALGAVLAIVGWWRWAS